MGNWYVFHVQTGREQTACNFLNKLFNREKSNAFIPQVELIFKRSNIIRKEQKPMFAGYIFADSIVDEKTFITQAYKYKKFSKCIYELLGGKNIEYMKLPDEEKNFLLSFCTDGYIADRSKGFIIGDKIVVTSGPLEGRESIIRKIDKMRAEVEVPFLGDTRRISVALEIISKIP
jgi:transcriptional antiterminator NusG